MGFQIRPYCFVLALRVLKSELGNVVMKRQKRRRKIDRREGGRGVGGVKRSNGAVTGAGEF